MSGRELEPPLRLDAHQQEVLGEEIAALHDALHDEAARERYAQLAEAVAAAEIPQALFPGLEEVLDLSLSTGRARRLHGAQHEAELLRLFFATARGTAIRRTTAEANEALRALSGHRLESLTFAAARPGVFRMRVATDRCEITLEVDRSAVSVDDLVVSGGG